MQKRILLAVVGVALLSFGSQLCVGQEVVHALIGTVSATNPKLHTITVKTDDGSQGVFKEIGAAQAKASASFDREIEAQTKPVDQFTKVGSRVILYYFGVGDMQTAVAVKDLGTASVHKSAGTVTDFDRHHHLLTLKNDAGQTAEISLNEQTSVETAEGVIDGSKYEANRGDRVRVTWVAPNGQDTALFVYAD